MNDEKRLRKILCILAAWIVLSGCSALQEKPIDPTGTYDLESETRVEGDDIFGYFGQIQVRRMIDEEIVMTFSINRGAPGYNSGSFVDTLTYQNNTAYFTRPGCRITFRFTGKGVDVKESRDNDGCGFGHAVAADGFFLQKSSEEPELRDPLTGEKI